MPNSRGGWLQEPGWEKFTLWAEAGEAPPLHLGNIVTLSAGLLDDPVPCITAPAPTGGLALAAGLEVVPVAPTPAVRKLDTQAAAAGPPS